ncbi:hypothetical protein [Massilia glaciei]|uniref:TOBE domain-containing protein n=1 Tax=Massilia glaciei TaxID=1524097 RepID=A0A2U2I6X3_9BURK|nr:hypothetical protein [Massilia glaciei]PWF55513.1 hypothetical protein C7C56_001465 [Massilia glaciei]
MDEEDHSCLLSVGFGGELRSHGYQGLKLLGQTRTLSRPGLNDMAAVTPSGGDSLTVKMAEAPAAGAPVTLGMRPEHIVLDTQGGIPATVFAVERPGPGRPALPLRLSLEKPICQAVAPQEKAKNPRARVHCGYSLAE